MPQSHARDQGSLGPTTHAHVRVPHSQSHSSLSPLCSPEVVVPVFGSDIRHDVLVEELQDQRDAVGKHQMLGHVLKLRRRSKMGQTLARITGSITWEWKPISSQE